MRPIQFWLSDADLQSVYSADYWNDIEAERTKDWWIENGDYDRCRRYLDTSNLMLEFEAAEARIKATARTGSQVLDLAAGIGWTSALLSKLDCVAQVHAVEISRHRLELLFPHAVAMFSAQGDKIQRYLGSFYDLQLPDQSMDVILMSQAFHHADRPLHLLVECDRVLKPGGQIVLIGEPHVTKKQFARRFFGTLVRRRRVVGDFYQLFPTDRQTGDHYYRHSDYSFMFRSLGYAASQQILKSGTVMYVADKP